MDLPYWSEEYILAKHSRYIKKVPIFMSHYIICKKEFAVDIHVTYLEKNWICGDIFQNLQRLILFFLVIQDLYLIFHMISMIF